jgi:hypothetical protein
MGIMKKKNEYKCDNCGKNCNTKSSLDLRATWFLYNKKREIFTDSNRIDVCDTCDKMIELGILEGIKM